MGYCAFGIIHIIKIKAMDEKIITLLDRSYDLLQETTMNYALTDKLKKSINDLLEDINQELLKTL